MTKIKNTVAYKIKTPLSLSDYAVGTNNEDGIPGYAKGQTISIGLNEMRELFLAGLSPETGGTLKITPSAQGEYLQNTGVCSEQNVPPFFVYIFFSNKWEYISFDFSIISSASNLEHLYFSITKPITISISLLRKKQYIFLYSIFNKNILFYLLIIH